MTGSLAASPPSFGSPAKSGSGSVSSSGSKSVSVSVSDSVSSSVICSSVSHLENTKLIKNVDSLSVPSDSFRSLSLFSVSVSVPDHNYSVSALIDSGSTHSTISTEIASIWNLSLIKLSVPLSVRLPNGRSVVLNHRVLTPLVINNLFSVSDFPLLVADFPHLPVILGSDWLKLVNPTINWKDRTMRISDNLIPLSDLPLYPKPHLLVDSSSALESAKVPLTGVPSDLSGNQSVSASSVSDPSDFQPPARNSVARRPCHDKDLSVSDLSPDCNPSLLSRATPVDISRSGSADADIPMLVRHPETMGWKQEVDMLSESRESGTSGKSVSVSNLSVFDVLFASMELITPLDDDEDFSVSDIPEQYRDFVDVFSHSASKSLPPRRRYDHKIELISEDNLPRTKLYKMSETERKVLNEYIDEFLSTGFIRPSSSPASSSPLFVPKKDGSLRLCVDYRRLNAITRKNRYPIPLIDQMLDQLHGNSYFTKLDLRGAYNLLRIAEGDEWKTAFVTPRGSFEYLVMPFGLTNAPASFQYLMNDLFRDMIEEFALIYLDDILIYSKSLEEHRRHIRRVLHRLRENGLYANPKKSFFETQRIEFLGFVVTPDGVEMDTAKIDAIRNWPAPTSVKSVQSFLGFANFYRRFISGYSKVVTPLTNLTKKSVPFIWSPDAQAAFDYLKSAFTSAPILAHFDPSQQIVLETDASDYAIAAILSQNDSMGVLHPVAYHSRKLSPAEMNYEIHDKELLAIVEAFKVWRHFVEGNPHTIRVLTDHRNLEYFMTRQLLTRRQARWSTLLLPYDFTIEFRPGTKSAKPDALTRRDDVYPEGERPFRDNNPQNEVTLFRMVNGGINAIRSFESPLMEKVRAAQENSSEISALKSESESDTYSGPISVRDNLVCKNKRVLVPKNDSVILEILKAYHDSPISGHPGQWKTLKLIERNFTWNGIRNSVIDYVKSCHVCSRNKTSRHQPYGLLQPLPIPDRPWQSISMDFIEELPESSGFNSIFVIVDRFTKFAHFVPTRTDISSLEMAKLLVSNVFSKHGVPEDIVSDRGSKFTSVFWEQLTKALGIQRNLSTAYHPQSDGQTERVNQVLESYLRIYTNYDQSNWSDLLPVAEFAYNNSPHATTKVSPFFANYGFNPNWEPGLADLKSPNAMALSENLKSTHHFVKEEIRKSQDRYKTQADKHRLPNPDFKPGDKVYLSARNIRTTRPTKKFSERQLGPFVIEKEISPVAFRLRLPKSLSKLHPVFHVSLLEKSYESSIPSRYNSPPAPVQIDGEEEFEVEAILDSRSRRGKPYYLVKWKGYDISDESQTWEPEENLENCSDLIAEFKLQRK